MIPAQRILEAHRRIQARQAIYTLTDEEATGIARTLRNRYGHAGLMRIITAGLDLNAGLMGKVQE